MIAIAPYKGAVKVMLDRDWLNLWTDQFPTPALAQEMLSNDRLSDRVAQLVLKRFNGHADLADLPADQNGADLKAILSYPRDALLRMLGLLWQAPVLAPVLPNAHVRQTYGLSNRAELDLALSYRLQTPPTVVGALENCPDFADDGVLCLLAWFEQFDSTLNDRLTLLFPKVAQKVESPIERAMLVARFIQDPTSREAVTQ
ncbi:MAG: hypothetical protein ABJN14_02270 [Paracoccaceae bacterium]